MKLSVMTYCYGRALAAGALDLDSMLRECARLRLDGVELVRAHAAGVSTADLKARVEDLGLAVPVLLEPAAIVDADAAKRAAAVQGLRPALDLAVALGTRQIMVLPSGDAAGAPDEEIRRRIGEAMAGACALARGSGVGMMVENHGGAARLRGRVSHMLEFCAAAPEMGLCFDDGNFFLAGDDQNAAFDQLGSRVVHMHLKDWRPANPDEGGVQALDGRRYIGAVIGEGVVHPRPAINRLAARGYDGYLSVEYEGPEDALVAVPRAVANARRLRDAAVAAAR